MLSPRMGDCREVQGLSFVCSTREVCCPYPLWNIQNLGAVISYLRRHLGDKLLTDQDTASRYNLRFFDAGLLPSSGYPTFGLSELLYQEIGRIGLSLKLL